MYVYHERDGMITFGRFVNEAGQSRQSIPTEEMLEWGPVHTFWGTFALLSHSHDGQTSQFIGQK